MSSNLKHSLIILILAALLLPLGLYLLQREMDSVVIEPKPRPEPQLSDLAEPPDWSELDDYQRVMARTDFLRDLQEVYVVSDIWKQFIDVEVESAMIDQGDGESYRLEFGPLGYEQRAPRYWKSTAELPTPPVGRPLYGLHIAIDPGHLGGEWAKMEARWFQIGNEAPICEGDMTLAVAKLLKPRLESLGAKVSLVRDKPGPITLFRPDDFMEMAEKEIGKDNPAAVKRLAEKWFYRTAEIRERARVVNEVLRPDLVLCLHFNAEAWGDPSNPTLIDRNHFHLLLNGAYTDDEVAMADQRFSMVKKLLSRSHREEANIGASVADVYTKVTGIPAFDYGSNAKNALKVDDNCCLWARNLLANRLYDCPVIYMEPYVMNSTLDYPRMQAGDYLGLKEVNGKLQPSIYREYAETLLAGLVRHYSEMRPKIGE